MKKLVKNLLAVSAICCSVGSFSQSSADAVLMTIDGKPVTKSEFETVFFKNNTSRTVADSKSISDYVELFINFKLKVREAEEMGLDTSKAFVTELNGYKKQLSSPYLTDKNVNDKLVTEAYDRLKFEVHASHILLKVAEDALPKDTLEAYNRIMNFRNRAEKGEDFARLARESAERGDPSAKDNGGDLGYFSAFGMLYSFESAAYVTKVGEISQPIRTRYGYHIIKVWDKRASQGEMLASHIMLRIKKNATTEDSANIKKKAFELYEKIKAGSSFEDMAAEYSDDKNTSQKGGQLPWFGYGKMPSQEFEKNAFALKNNGDITSPFTTSFGWHIVKRVDKKDLASFDQMKNELKQKVAKDSRTQMGKASLISRIKKENNFKENKVIKNKKEIFSSFDELVSKLDTSYWEGKWNMEKAKGLNKTLFTLGAKNYTQADFAKYIEQRQTKRSKNDFNAIMTIQYNNFVADQCVAQEEGQLDKKYPDFKALMQEYRDGILLFDLTDKKVWTKAMKDTVGLANFYAANKNSYLWEERADVTLYKCNDTKIAKDVAKLLKKKKTEKQITLAINKTSQLNVSVETITYLKGERKIIDNNWKLGISEIMKDSTDSKIYVLNVNNLLPRSPKALNEAKGIITADYQNYLEKQWLASLREKYKVVLNNEVLKTIK